MHIKAVAAVFLASATVLALPASAATVVDPVGDFLPSYTAGAMLPDLDVTSFSISYNGATQVFILGATFAGTIDPATPGLYVFGVNTGTGTVRPFAAIGQPNVIFNQAIVIQKNGTGNVGATALDPLGISITGNILTARVPLSLLPTTGFAPLNYGFNLWPRIGVGNNNQITDFAPDNALLPVVAIPEPGMWMLMLIGFAAVGTALRYRRRRTMVAFA